MKTLDYTQLTLHLNRDYGALNRLLGLIRQRCFEIENMHVHPENKTTFRVQIVVYSERNVAHLMKKLNQMVEVQSLAANKLTPVEDETPQLFRPMSSNNGSAVSALAAS